jgi:hypothetical protein
MERKYSPKELRQFRDYLDQKLTKDSEILLKDSYSSIDLLNPKITEELEVVPKIPDLFTDFFDQEFTEEIKSIKIVPPFPDIKEHEASLEPEANTIDGGEISAWDRLAGCICGLLSKITEVFNNLSERVFFL